MPILSRLFSLAQAASLAVYPDTSPPYISTITLAVYPDISPLYGWMMSDLPHRALFSPLL